MNQYTKWVATWANATSIIDQIATRYAKNLTLRYPIISCFDGDHLRLHFSNLTGTEAVRLQASVARTSEEVCNGKDKGILKGTSVDVHLNGNREIVIEPGKEVVSDPIAFAVHAREKISISIYLKEATQMNAGVLTLVRSSYRGGDD